MSKTKEKTEEIAYDSEIFQRLNQSLESGIISNAPRIFAKLAEALVSKKIISKTGKIAANRESSLIYLSKVLPYMTFRDFAILEAEPEVFITKYLFCPSDRKVSLATYLQSQGVLDEDFRLKADLGWRSESSEIFEEFRDQLELSPFEKVDKYVLINFWGMAEED